MKVYLAVHSGWEEFEIFSVHEKPETAQKIVDEKRKEFFEERPMVQEDLHSFHVSEIEVLP